MADDLENGLTAHMIYAGGDEARKMQMQNVDAGAETRCKMQKNKKRYVMQIVEIQRISECYLSNFGDRL